MARSGVRRLSRLQSLWRTNAVLTADLARRQSSLHGGRRLGRSAMGRRGWLDPQAGSPHCAPCQQPGRGGEYRLLSLYLQAADCLPESCVAWPCKGRNEFAIPARKPSLARCRSVHWRQHSLQAAVRGTPSPRETRAHPTGRACLAGSRAESSASERLLLVPWMARETHTACWLITSRWGRCVQNPENSRGPDDLRWRRSSALALAVQAAGQAANGPSPAWVSAFLRL